MYIDKDADPKKVVSHQDNSMPSSTESLRKSQTHLLNWETPAS